MSPPRTKNRVQRAARAALIACALLAGARALADAEPIRVDGLAAVVGGEGPAPGSEVILRSDVELRARIIDAGLHAAPLSLDPIPSAMLTAALNEIIGEHLIAREAKRVQAANPSGADVERERRQLVRSAGGSERMAALLALLGAPSEELDVIAKRRAQVGAFLSANLEGVTVVTDSQLQRALDAAKQTDPRDPAILRGELRAKLAREALDRTIERWVTVLRSRTPLRIYAQY